MSEPSLSNQATNPEPSVVASQQAQPSTTQTVQGSAMLDADVETGGNQPEGEPINAPIATNFSDATATGDSKTAAASGEVGSFSTNTSSAEKSSVNLHNGSEVPSDRSDSVQGTLPDTDPIKLSTDPEANLPD